ncbi:septum site-determining protein MinC [Glaciimonas sp. CA11.2]|uniref:septum site-determining protein MinC n=1 Tax=unclassified Glaciimonas TaxID=2644401 RepID=UPI002AB48862|nr:MULTISPECIES: septum site-determining protein MinC [unclassified Glaciimonas]MDY7546534.1 septum site-determining protein MinC [Glaciimonas sp. CA11.2]MEB0012924.1 septum site-determining protein MinC [Glaciimonas sp. Cout2]MEB0080784.1 septum site-determining protein MinC [Glaciimonas sp. Gout2]MEB0162099.1 septum site-determining protein MinC [Glaciimonas sp. CA11.2]
MPKNKTRKPIEIKIATVVAVSVILHDVDLAVLDDALKEMTGGNADFFDNEFAVIDIAALGESNDYIEWSALVKLLKTYQLNAVAVRNAPDTIHPAIIANGLSIDTVIAPRAEPNAPAVQPTEVLTINAPEVVVSQPPATLATSAATPLQQPMIVDTPVRAGQRIYARGSDLIITAMVNNGAEIIADGSIHVYAPLRGRALAGASGDTKARIFATAMEPELVSIAGVYRTFEHGFPAELKGQAAQIQLNGDRIDVISLNSPSRS